MKIPGKGSLMASGALLALAVAAVLATQAGVQAQTWIGECGKGGGNICEEVKVCGWTECVTTTRHYKAEMY